jgi:hypothetical protein
VPEVRRLLQALAEGPTRRAGRLHWSRWRRGHQATARRCHAARRACGPPPPEAPGPSPVAVPGTPPLTEAGWVRLAAILPARPRRGKRRWTLRHLLDGILWVMHTGASWREVPQRFAPWHTVYDRHARWRRDGTWARILAVLLSQDVPS